MVDPHRHFTPSSVEPSDAVLWHGIQSAVEPDFAVLFRRYNKLVYNFAFRATASWSQAEEITQATFTTLWRRCREGSVETLRRESAAPILLAMARNEVLNVSRGGRRRLSLVQRLETEPARTSSDNVTEWADQEAGMARVRQVLARLPENQRAVIELVVWSGLNLEECADVLEIPVGTVKSRLSRARAKLATSEVAHLLGRDE